MDSINLLIKHMVEMEASDLHLKVGSPAIIRVNRDLVPVGSTILTPDKIQHFSQELMSPLQREIFNKHWEIDFAYTAPGFGRFRTNIFHQRGSVSIVMRFVKTEIPEFSSLHLPTSLGNFAMKENGIILVAGATNSGKSTTLAAMLNHLNRNTRKHIITIEDPIEYLHQDRLCIVNQREVGIDTVTFEIALKHVLRQDPDVILIGEMRDADSFSAALQAAETGHLVLTTVHASSAGNTIDRILDFFRDPVLRDQARFQLANNIVAIICQKLLPKKDGSGLIPAIEILTGTSTARKAVRENALHKIPQIISSGQDMDMVSFNTSILKLINSEEISQETGLAYASNPDALKMNLQGIFLDEGRRILS